MRPTTVYAVFVAILSSAAPALAQGPLSTFPAEMPRWDAAGSIGLHWAPQTNLSWPEGGDGDNWNVNGEYRIDVGRYWTEHLKTEFGFSTTNRWSSYEQELLSVAELRSGRGYAYIDRRLRLNAFSPAVTYQFLENSLMHPYVTGGMRINVLREHRVRTPTTYRISGVTYTVPPLDERRTTATLNPFVGVGSKSYLSSHTFFRSEALVAFGRRGGSNVALRLGFGVDF